MSATTEGRALTDLYLETKFIWDVETVIDKATTAATLMDLRIHKRTPNGFVAGSQWWGSYELAIHAKTVFRTKLTVGASTLKIGFQDTLRRRAQLFIDLARDPQNAVGQGETVEIVERTPTVAYRDWKEFIPDDDNSDVVQTQMLAMQADRGRLAIESLRNRVRGMRGVDLGSGQWDQLSEITAEALSSAPDTLPIYVETPLDIERWYGYLQEQWALAPEMVESLSEAMNENRRLNAQWFQANGHGGH